jgi:hypothetical protein
MEQLCEYNPEKVSKFLDELNSDDSFRELARYYNQDVNYFHIMRMTAREKFDKIFHGEFDGSIKDRAKAYELYIEELKDYVQSYVYTFPKVSAIGKFLDDEGFRDIGLNASGHKNYIPFANSFIVSLFNTKHPFTYSVSKVKEFEDIRNLVESRGGIPEVDPMDMLDIHIGKEY